MGRNLDKAIKYIINALVFITIGSMLTIFVKKTTQFTISNELYIPDLLTLVVTIILSMYLGYSLERSKNNERIKKDRIIEYYKEYYQLLETKVRVILDNRLESKKIASSFKMLRIRLYKLKGTTVERKLMTQDNELINKIFEEVTILWQLCTGDRDVRDDRTIEDIEFSLIKTENLIFELILEINET